MCGIVGALGPAGASESRRRVVRRMAATLRHRGPDGEGHFDGSECSFGFRRLAIMSPESASQPYSNEDASIWCQANAEIYNAGRLRAELEARGHRFRTGTDTEILPHLYEELGASFVERLNGMFAIALWDERERRLLLARDRAGEKPLFYWHRGDELVFASELRALISHPSVPVAVDPVGLHRYLVHDFFPAPLTPLAEVRKLPAGHLLSVHDGELALRRYWDLAEHFDDPTLARRGTSDLVDELDSRLSRAIQRRRRSDVPIGVFLSGGIDSSTVLAYLADQAGSGVPAFSVGHDDPSFDESSFARETARAFDADFDPLILSEADLAEGLERVGEGFDEPLGDASIIPTHLLARHARRKVKVVLSGEGADEIFAGYPTYLGHRVAAAYRRLPGALRRGLLSSATRVMPVGMGQVGPAYLLERFATAAERDLVERHHVWFGSVGPDLERALLGRHLRELLADDDPFGSARARHSEGPSADDLSRLLYTDFTMYLQDDLLTKVDRATMLASLEARAPFLDHELVEFVAGLPSRRKLSGLTTKVILRKTVRGKLPKRVLARRKRGFSIPFSRWVLHGLGDELKRRFSLERVAARGLLAPAGIAALLDDHLERRADHRKALFNLLALDLWCDQLFGEGNAVPVGLDRSEEAHAARRAS